jgi:hypothetical protein
MPYVLTLFVLAPHGELKITEQFYNEIKEANEGLPKIVAVEEKFDALMENFVELESTILSLGARHVAFVDVNITDLIEPRNLISRRISNFLASARLYRDALPQHVPHIFGRNDAKAAAFCTHVQDLKAQPTTYRMVEAFRNYVQHRELPLTDIVFRRSREGVIEQKATAFACWLEPLIDAVAVSKMREIQKDKEVVARLVELGMTVNPMPLLREYIEQVGAIHLKFRELIKAKETAWEESHASARARYKLRFPKASVIALGAGFRHKNGTIPDPQYVSQDRADYRKYLRIKHLTTANFSKRYVKWSV